MATLEERLEDFFMQGASIEEVNTRDGYLTLRGNDGRFLTILAKARGRGIPTLRITLEKP